MEHDPERMGRIRRVSADLARKRGPAGYVEILCTEDEARAALEGAEEAFRLAEEHVGPLPDGPFSPGS